MDSSVKKEKKQNEEKSSKSRKVHKKSDDKPKRQSRSAKAGLVFPISRVERLLREGRFGFKKLYSHATVYLAAVLEYLVLEVLEVSLQWCKSKNRTRIVPNHINWAVESDLELAQLFKDVHIAGAGIFPQFVEYPKSKSKKSSSKSQDASTSTSTSTSTSNSKKNQDDSSERPPSQEF